ncbi:MAG TPA: DNA-3-methyladenine glycosylase I [Acidimicrobiia bacterium]|nr:DNA-3-methyladenine glycosylase I [Acidimicrobiia bacterium]
MLPDDGGPIHTLTVGDDGFPRCWWGAEPEIYRLYHDDEWGRPTTDDHRLFEKICLEGFQAGLSWLTILRKRDNFRAAFDDFDPDVVTRYDDQDVLRLLNDAGIVRHQGKIRSTINNAGRALEVVNEHGSLATYFWSWADTDDTPPGEIPSTTPTSTALSKDLKKRGWTFVGPTTVYAFMQAMGLVNDHLEGCHVRAACEAARQGLLRD